MAGITGQGTTFNLPNYVGELFAVTPEDTPLLSLIGGLTGGKETTSAIFGWQKYDLRSASATAQALEGAAAPTAQNRVRANIFNITEIHHETVEVSYSKQIYTGQYGQMAATYPEADGIAGTNPVLDEKAWQIEQMLKQIARDIEMSFISGTYNEPATNAAARRTRGLFDAITTNTFDAGNAPLTEDMVLDSMQSAWENGGLMEGETRTLMCNASQKRKLSQIFITDKNYQELSRNVGGVNLQTFETDFGRCNIVLNRHMPTDAILILSLEDLAPVFGVVPGKGHLFSEPLAKTGSADKEQLYCEVGLEYGLESHHAEILNLNTTGS